MTSDHPSTADMTPAPSPRRGAAVRPDPAPLLQGLDRIQEALCDRLDRLEALALERPDSALPPSVREEELRRKIAELEARQERMVFEVRRREQEWDALLAKLEEDRRLLAEAWERLERERTEGPPAVAAPRASPAARPAPAAPPARSFADADADDRDVVSHEILKQFKALRGDVRKNAGGCRPRR